MITTNQFDALLTQLRYRPTTTNLYDQLVHEYESTSAEGRAYIRSALVSSDDLVKRIADWCPGRVADNPHRFVQIRLSVISMIDGYPSYVKARHELRELWSIAERYAIDPMPYFQYAAKISSGIRTVSVKYLIKQVILQRQANILYQGAST